MANLINITAEAGANMIGDDATPTLTFSNTVGPALEVIGAISGNASVSGLKLTQSTASGAVLNLGGKSFVSAVSIVFAASANWAGLGAVRVVRTDGTFGWIPVLPNAVVTAAAVE
jgi:hypothetical protein